MNVSKTDPSRRGFTLVEIMIVVAIIGLLAAIAVPNFVKARKSAQNVAFVKSIKTFADAFTLYSLENRQYPPDTTPSVVPPGMAPYLNVTLWQGTTPIGGQWDWDNGQFGFKAGVSVYQPTADATQMQEIDRLLDDGNLGTGLFRARSDGYIFMIEP
ncbi:MAG: type II secretion system protein [Verrucomicrobiota bacterium]